MSVIKMVLSIIILFCVVTILSCSTSEAIEEVEQESLLATSDMIVINEIASTGDYEFIELHNTMDISVVLGSGWVLDDDGAEYEDGARVFVVPEGLIIPAKGFLILCPFMEDDVNTILNNKSIPDDAIIIQSFSINNSDTINLYFNEEVIDSISWKNDVNTIGRNHEQNLEVSRLLIPTPGDENTEEFISNYSSTIVINEINSSGDDYIELFNAGEVTYNFGDGIWTLEDIMKNPFITIPNDITLLPNDFLVIYPNRKSSQISYNDKLFSFDSVDRFGLGGGDSIYLRRNGEIIEYHEWNQHVNSAGRYPDGSEKWVNDLKLTFGSENEMN